MSKVVPIFFACDDNYIPFLSVCLKSLIDNSSKKYKYKIKILYTKVKNENIRNLKKYNSDNIDIEFVNIKANLSKINNKLYTRDYYTNTTYYRLFIPNLYKEYDKALYIDADTVILDDIAKLYNINIKDNLVGAVTDGIIKNNKVFREYAEKVIGLNNYKNYFNAGVLILNLKELRNFDFENKFLYLLDTVKFTLAQDQDYLNRLCKGRVKIINDNWDVMPSDAKNHKNERKIKLIHYNLAEKPWLYDNIPFEKYFWYYAKDTNYYKTIIKIKNSYTLKDKKNDSIMFKNMLEIAKKECSCVGDIKNGKR